MYIFEAHMFFYVDTFMQVLSLKIAVSNELFKNDVNLINPLLKLLTFWHLRKLVIF